MKPNDYGSASAHAGRILQAKESLTSLTRSLAWLLLLALSPTVSAQTTANYDLGAIPDLTVRDDTELVFFVNTTPNAAPPFTMTCGMPPAGAVTLTTNGLFHYVPAPADKTPFAVTIVAGSGLSQTFTITPLPILPTEFTVFGTGERTQLTNSVASDIIKLDRPSVLTTMFNYAPRTVHSVSIISSGTNVLEAGNPNGLFEAYFNGRLDISDVELTAETLIIRSPLVLKQTKVSIYARELRFEGAGKIITTPQELALPAADATGPTQRGGDGTNGLPAGSVNVFVETFTDATGNSDPKFVLTGGKGQGAGKGKHGVDGASLSWYYSGQFSCYADCCWPFSCKDWAYYTPPAGWYVTRWKGFSGDILNGVEQWPGDGTPAWEPGTPGRGGDGGTLTTSHPSVAGLYGGGVAGVPGNPVATSGHWRTDICEGGFGGWPRNSIHIYAWTSGLGCTSHISEDGRRTSVDGISYTTIPTASPGTAGVRNIAGTPFSWLNPQLLRKVINDAKDDYLQNRISAAEAKLKDYAAVLDLYRADTNIWSNTNALPLMSRYELSQMYDETRLLLQQIANGLDYFGNPNGWVPMLSFEVNANLFDQEIDRSLDIVYLAKWITRKQGDATETFNALGTARTKLAAEIDAAKVSYDAATADLASLEGEALDLSQRIASLQIQLETKDNELHAEALRNSRPPEWETALRLGLKTAAVICEMVPVYQPALGAVGGALKLGSDFDPDNPWATITNGLDLTTTYLNSQVKDASDAQKVEKDKVNTGELEQSNKRIENLKNLSQASTALSSGIKDITGFLEKSKAPSSHMAAELDRLRSTDPQYSNLVNQITLLMQDKRQFADKIVAAIYNVVSLSDLITRDILAMDGLSVQIGDRANLIDARVNAYLKDMERRAFDRLLKYHYYMAKAYEFRMVRPYNATLNLENLYNNMEVIANASTNAASRGQLDAGQKDLLKSVFKEVIAATTESIITDYNDDPSEPGSSFTFDLLPSEIASLNRGEAITLNLVNEGFFMPWEENVRIADLGVYAPAPSGIATTGTYGSPAYIDLIMEHSGLSDVKLDGQVYQFRHYNQSTRNAITWKTRYEPKPNIISPTPLVAANDSLLRALLPGLNTSDVLLYSRPSAWADLRIWRAGNNGGVSFGLGQSNAPITLTKATLQVSYDRVTRSDTPTRRRSIEVIPAVVVDNLGTTQIQDAMAPYFMVSSSDPNGRQDGQGRFLRIYNYNTPPTVQVTAQDLYGSLGFYGWNEDGLDVSSNPTISVSPTADHRLVAKYVSLLPIPITLQKGSGRQTILSWQGGAGIKLQTRTCLLDGCPWQDVPGTEGASSFTVTPPLIGSAYFRLIRVR